MKTLFTFTAVLVLVLLMVVAVSLPLADLYANEGQRLLNRWFVTTWLTAAKEVDESVAEESPQAIPPKWLRERVQRFSSLAARLDPWNSAAVTSLGSLHEARFAEEPLDAHLKQALECYRKSIALRPAAPQGWSSLARVKLEQGWFDLELALGLERALLFGPWERSVQLALLEAALPAWRGLSAELREGIRSNVDRSLQMDPALVVNLVEEYGYIRGRISEADALELGLIEY